MSCSKSIQNHEQKGSIDLSQNSSHAEGRCENSTWNWATQSQSCKYEFHNEKQNIVTFVQRPFLNVVHSFPGKRKLISDA
jgi:hypothetical protein